jgi:outer membrane protein OmpA-like peptidoglycan-associated protein
MTFRQLLLAATVVAAPGAALAQPTTAWYLPTSYLPTASATAVQGVYIGAGAGWNHTDKRGMTALGGNAAYFDSIGSSRQGGLRPKDGVGGVLSVGWGFGNGLRAELEGSYRINEIDKFGGFQGGRAGGRATSAFNGFNGEQQQYGVMANLLYDFQLPQWFPNMPVAIVPYIGGGVGYQWTDISAKGSRNGGGNTISINDNTGDFAYQGIAGAAFPISAVPGLAATLEYRYMGVLQTKQNGHVSTPSGQNVSRGQFEIDQANNHSVMLGIRYAFNQPAPAMVAPAPVVAPAAAPAPARTYLVFFDFDRADLTDRARQIIAEAAQNSTRVQSTRIEVAGHADRSGSPQYNQRLSQRRADAVAAELVRLGVSRTGITVQAFGESRPLVATADGVREPQNRRVEIVLR